MVSFIQTPFHFLTLLSIADLNRQAPQNTVTFALSLCDTFKWSSFWKYNISKMKKTSVLLVIRDITESFKLSFWTPPVYLILFLLVSFPFHFRRDLVCKSHFLLSKNYSVLFFSQLFGLTPIKKARRTCFWLSLFRWIGTKEIDVLFLSCGQEWIQTIQPSHLQTAAVELSVPVFGSAGVCGFAQLGLGCSGTSELVEQLLVGYGWCCGISVLTTLFLCHFTPSGFWFSIGIFQSRQVGAVGGIGAVGFSGSLPGFLGTATSGCMTNKPSVVLAFAHLL